MYTSASHLNLSDAVGGSSTYDVEPGHLYSFAHNRHPLIATERGSVVMERAFLLVALESIGGTWRFTSVSADGVLTFCFKTHDMFRRHARRLT